MWTKIADRNPPHDGKFWVCINPNDIHQSMFFAYYNGEKSWYCMACDHHCPFYDTEDVPGYWMPLPQFPDEYR